MTVSSSSSKLLSIDLLRKFRDATESAYKEQNDSKLLWRLAELDRALGDLINAAKEYGSLENPEYIKDAQFLKTLMQGEASDYVQTTNGVVPFVLIPNFAPELDLVMVRQAIEARRNGFAEAKVRYNNEHRVDTDTRSALFFRGDEAFKKLSRKFFYEAIQEKQIVKRLGVEEISNAQEEIEAIAYTTGGKYTMHRDNKNNSHEDNGRRLTAVWFIHDEPKGFSGGDLLLYDEPPTGQSFTRIIPQRNSVVFFPSDRLHEVTPVESTAHDVLQSRVVLNAWFHQNKF